MPNLQYNFVNSYDNLSVVTIPLCVINFSNVNTTSCYCGDIDTVTCYPVFDNLPSQLNFIENWGYYIDFGDGTIVSSLTAKHNYEIPGTYKITLVVADSANNLFKSVFTPSIEAYNLIPDRLTFTYLSGNSAYSSSANIPLQIVRTNSFQTYPSLSAEGYSVKLSVSGNRSKFQTISSYETDQYSHLKLFSMFTLSGDVYPLNEVVTTCDKIYAQISPLTNQILYSNSETSGIGGVDTVFVGTSGIVNIYYYEDYRVGPYSEVFPLFPPTPPLPATTTTTAAPTTTTTTAAPTTTTTTAAPTTTTTTAAPTTTTTAAPSVLALLQEDGSEFNTESTGNIEIEV